MKSFEDVKMKVGDKVKYFGGDSDGLKNQKGKIIGETLFFGKKLWIVEFGRDIGKRHCLEINLKVVDYQMTFIFHD